MPDDQRRTTSGGAKSKPHAGDSPLAKFAELVNSVGVKAFASRVGLTSRHINRMLAGGHPNPVTRLIAALQAADPEAGDALLDYICQEMGGHFVRIEAADRTAINAVRECAEAIAAISDGHISASDLHDIREAIGALTALSLSLNRRDGQLGQDDTDGA
ncbi:MAG: hypothetical protein ACR2GY_10755 [Phycisphaerales bacterium]